MFLEARSFWCKCIELPPDGDFTIGSNYPFEYLIDAERVIDNSNNEITFAENSFKTYFENIREATTSYSTVLQDCTVYKIYLVLGEEIPSIEEIKAYAGVMNRNYLQARKALRYKKNLLVSGKALDIGKMLEKLHAFPVHYEIEPTYPYEDFFK